MKLIKNHVMKLYHSSIGSNQNKALTSPIRGKKQRVCESYQPVSVLNVDSELFSSIIAKRMEHLLPELIDEDQTGIIKGRQTQDSIRRIIQLTDKTIKQKHVQL